MSLVNTLLNGGMTSGSSVDATKYSHSNGAHRIAMESVAELHDIFMESFYNTNQAELAAATEGVALEGSQYEAVIEASVSNTFAKVKAFFKKLWDKVKAFFHSVRRYFDAIFMSATDFVKKYAQDIRNTNGKLKDFEFKMFKYNNSEIDKASKVTASEISEDIIADINTHLTLVSDGSAVEFDQAGDEDKVKAFNTKMEGAMADLRKVLDTDAIAKKTAAKFGCSDPDEFDEFLFGLYRNGATDSSDKEDVEVTNLGEFVEVLNGSKKLATDVDKMAKATDAGYSKAIKAVDAAENKFGKHSSKVSGNVTEALRLMSSAISTAQTYENKRMNAWKAVIKERDSAYKSMIMAAMSYAKKNNK